MTNRDFETHRCKGSLESECAIRKYPKTSEGYTYKDGKWHLFDRVYNMDYEWVGVDEIATILYCPWCGIKLSK